ncbi:MAG: hypothetical protein WAN65_16580 [Candidatus Sulfotelmatobacter sp.]
MTLRLAPDVPVGSPAFRLSNDRVATVLDLLCRAAYEARPYVTAGMLEVPITLIIRKAARRIKSQLGLTDLEIRGEHELEDMAFPDATLLGRIDISLKFLEHFGDQDAYVGVECKRVGAGLSQLNRRYVTEGVARFATGQYAAGHPRAFILAYVLALPVKTPIQSIDRRLRKTYGTSAQMAPGAPHRLALAVQTSTLHQDGGHMIRLDHVFMDMTCASGIVGGT